MGQVVDRPAASVCLPAVPVTGQARFVPPPGSCDAHVHVFGDPVRYPYAPERSFTPSPGQTLAALDALHGALGFGLDVVVDHMGRITTDRGLDSPGFQHLCTLLRTGRVWCKLSGADRISVAGQPYADAVPYARALLNANRDRVVWGTDWPHVNYYDHPVPSDTGLVDLLPDMAPDAADRQRLLVDNPRELYGF